MRETVLVPGAHIVSVTLGLARLVARVTVEARHALRVGGAELFLGLPIVGNAPGLLRVCGLAHVGLGTHEVGPAGFRLGQNRAARAGGCSLGEPASGPLGAIEHVEAGAIGLHGAGEHQLGVARFGQRSAGLETHVAGGGRVFVGLHAGIEGLLVEDHASPTDRFEEHAVLGHTGRVKEVFAPD